MNELFLHKVPVDTEIPTSIILLNFSAPYPQKSMFFLSITILLEFQSHQPFQTCGLLDFASSLETHEVVQGVKCKPKIYTMCFILLTFLFLNIPRMSWTVCNYSTCKICPLLKTLQRTMFPHFFFFWDIVHQKPILTNAGKLHAVHVGFQHSTFSCFDY